MLLNVALNLYIDNVLRAGRAKFVIVTDLPALFPRFDKTKEYYKVFTNKIKHTETVKNFETYL